MQNNNFLMQHHTQLQNDLSSAAQVISNQITKLNKLSKKFDMLDTHFRKQIVQNIKAGNNIRYKALASERVNIHKIQDRKSVMQAYSVSVREDLECRGNSKKQ